jgi:hypothetical protein
MVKRGRNKGTVFVTILSMLNETFDTRRLCSQKNADPVVERDGNLDVLRGSTLIESLGEKPYGHVERCNLNLFGCCFVVQRRHLVPPFHSISCSRFRAIAPAITRLTKYLSQHPGTAAIRADIGHAVGTLHRAPGRNRKRDFVVLVW